MSKTGAAPSLTQAERTALSDRAMIDAACELLLEKGAAGTTLAAIGERAGYSRGLATYRFGSKAGLLAAVGKTVSKRWLAYLQAGVGSMTGIDAMCAAIAAYGRFVVESPDDARIQQVLFAEVAGPLSESRSTAVDVYRRQFADIGKWLEQGMADGTIRADADKQAVAVQFLSVIIGTTHLWLLTPTDVDFEAVQRSYQAQLRSYLSKI